MNRQEAETIIKEEELTRVNWYNEQELKENQVGIRIERNIWIVYVTDERANIVDGSVTQLKLIAGIIHLVMNYI